MSIAGIMYQLEDYFKEKKKKMFWLFRIILIDTSILLVWGLVSGLGIVFLLGLAGILLLVIIFFYIFSQEEPKDQKKEKELSSKKKTAIKELSERLENCC